ncbi:UNVERIFIED_CONTAM: hypothetical protein FKN15_051248 [Acipenser sinensis]
MEATWALGSLKGKVVKQTSDPLLPANEEDKEAIKTEEIFRNQVTVCKLNNHLPVNGPVVNSTVLHGNPFSCPGRIPGLIEADSLNSSGDWFVVANVHQMALERRVGPVLDSQVCSPDCPEGLSCRNTAQYPANCSVRFLSPLANN